MNTTANTPRKATIVPEVGMGATAGAGSDRYPYTIVEVSKTGKAIKVQQDETMVVRGDLYSGQSDYVTMPNPAATVEEYTLRKNGAWIRKGQPITAHWASISIGTRRYYMDPGF